MRTCKLCARTRPEGFFARNGRYRKPYCRSCYNAYQSIRAKVDRSENRSVTMEEFRDYWLPLMVEAGEAPWAAVEEVPDVVLEHLTDEEKTVRHDAIMAELAATDPLRAPSS